MELVNCNLIDFTGIFSIGIDIQRSLVHLLRIPLISRPIRMCLSQENLSNQVRVRVRVGLWCIGSTSVHSLWFFSSRCTSSSRCQQVHYLAYCTSTLMGKQWQIRQSTGWNVIKSTVLCMTSRNVNHNDNKWSKPSRDGIKILPVFKVSWTKVYNGKKPETNLMLAM